jgi:hypothetical protein
MASSHTRRRRSRTCRRVPPGVVRTARSSADNGPRRATANRGASLRPGRADLAPTRRKPTAATRCRAPPPALARSNRLTGIFRSGRCRHHEGPPTARRWPPFAAMARGGGPSHSRSSVFPNRPARAPWPERVADSAGAAAPARQWQLWRSSTTAAWDRASARAPADCRCST